MSRKIRVPIVVMALVTAALVFSTATAQVGQEIIRNGEFFGLDEWSFYGEGASWRLDSALSNGWAEVHVRQGGGNIQLYQKNLPLEPGRTYRLTFEAASSSGNDVSVIMNKHRKPFTRYGLDAMCDIPLGDMLNGWQTCEVEFQADGFDEPVADARLRFWLKRARAGDEYEFDNVSLKEISEAGTLNMCKCQ